MPDFRTRGRGPSRRVYPITGGRMRGVKRTVISGIPSSQEVFVPKYPLPKPQNVIRQHFQISEETKRQVADEILGYVEKRFGEEASNALAATIMQIIPSGLGGIIQPNIEIEANSKGSRWLVGVSVPIDLSKYLGGSAFQAVTGTPTFYANAQYRVRVNRSARTAQYLDFTIGFSQRPAWSKEGVQVEWRKSFRPRS